MSDPIMMGDSGFEKRLHDNVRRLDDKIEAAIDLQDEKNDHLRSVVEGNDRRYKERFDAQEAANRYAQEKANEFRGSLQDIGERQMPRTEAEREFKSTSEKIDAGLRAINEKLEGLRGEMDRNAGRSTMSDPLVAKLSADIAGLRESRQEAAGDKGGRFSQQQLLVTIISLAAMLVTLFMTVRN